MFVAKAHPTRRGLAGSPPPRAPAPTAGPDVSVGNNQGYILWDLKKLAKMPKNLGTGTGSEIDKPGVSRALREATGTEKHREGDGGGPGARCGRILW